MVYQYFVNRTMIFQYCLANLKRAIFSMKTILDISCFILNESAVFFMMDITKVLKCLPYSANERCLKKCRYQYDKKLTAQQSNLEMDKEIFPSTRGVETFISTT